MNEKIRITLNDKIIEVKRGIKILDLLDYIDGGKGEYPIVAAHVEHKLVTLHYTLLHDSEIKFIDLSHPDGRRVYERSLAFLMNFASEKVLPGVKILVLHSYKNGIYCEAVRDKPLSEEEVKAIKEEMLKIVEEDLPIIPETIDEETGIKIFSEMGNRDDAVRLFKYMPEHQRIFVYRINDFVDYSYLPLAPRTGVLSRFDLVPYPPGFVIILPERLNPSIILPLKEQPKLFFTFEESARWARILGVQDAGSLNRIIATGDISDFIKIAEALHEKKIAEIADEITRDYDRIKVVLIAGPSSSGKTTFAKRLAVQLLVNERKPISLSLDSYFLDREKTPKDEEGRYDFDSIKALDLELLNEHLEDILKGKEVTIPKFDFKRGKRMGGRKLRLERDQILLIEGIHALNPKVSEVIPDEIKFKIYVSALTQINIDAHNRISTSDTRLIRRIVRDKLFRGHSARDNLRIWPNVRKGEEMNIFPYQENADAMFNSALVYELSVLKLYVDPLLEEIGPDVPEYADAVRLIGLLSHFLVMPPDEVPPTSILREFIGGSSFRY
jgi:uridine kinase